MKNEYPLYDELFYLFNRIKLRSPLEMQERLYGDILYKKRVLDGDYNFIFKPVSPAKLLSWSETLDKGAAKRGHRVKRTGSCIL